MLRGRPLSKKTGNIYYDLKVSTIRKDDTFFAGEPVVTITRGKKFLQSKVSVDICEEIVKRKQEDIQFRKLLSAQLIIQIFCASSIKAKIMHHFVSVVKSWEYLNAL